MKLLLNLFGKESLLTLAATLLGASAFAQTNQLRGTITDERSRPLVGVNVMLINQKDSTDRLGTVTDTAGVFQFSNLPVQPYQLRASYIGFNDYTRTVMVLGEGLDLGLIRLVEGARQLKEVKVVGKLPTAEQKGDTLQFNANAFKVNRDAQAEDLLKKMPGVDVSGGAVKVQGENVQEILVDGKPFFGDDPAIALKNLPAEVISRIEVFDRLSDQAQFTGVNDGNTVKTINIVTRPDRQNGQFGKVYGGVGTQGTYAAGGSVNLFNKDRRISVIGQSNNINQQNFSSQDLLGVLGSSGQRPGGGGQGGRGGGGRRGGGGSGGPGGGGGGNVSDNFLVGQQNGINTTNSLGINYSDTWGSKLTVRGSYFFNNSQNRNEQSLLRQYYATGDSTQSYRENSFTNNQNFNHRLNFRFDYRINSNNSILITPRLSWQQNRSTSVTDSRTLLDSTLLNTSDNTYSSNNRGYNFDNNILFRHRFAKRGRTLSLNLGTTLTNRLGNNSLLSQNGYFNGDTTTQLLNQQTRNENRGYQLSGNVTYTEPVGKGLLQFSYNVNLNHTDADRRTFRLNPATDDYDRLDSLLSNTFDNDYLTQRAGAGYTLNGKKLRLSATLGYQRADLMSNQLFPRVNEVDRTFNNFLPSLMLDYRLTDESRLRLMYRTSTQAPGINQLQNVVDNSNPLLLTAGNPDLKQTYSHFLTARYTLTTPEKARSLVGLVNLNYTGDYIGSSLFLADEPTRLPGGIFLPKGAQLTRPVNLENALNLRTFVSFGTPLPFIKSNLNLNTTFNYNRTPSLINNRTNLANTYTFGQGVVLGSNISEKLDFTVSYSFNYSNVANSLQAQLNNDYTTRIAGAQLNWTLWKGLVVRSDLSHQGYQGLTGGFNQNFTLWNASLAKKLFKNQSGELRLSVFDLLNQNNSISRTFSETYLEDNRSLVLKRYFMLTFTYNLRHYKS
ncbi:TonB-dependent receptor [Larkinella soli]|uniref:TonB-dependent receptor n=1 Tax=Larkinella soli TaxID=1770527 RepID=UPI000FFBE146|nr:TonB-dependent receptor [Larkinella soli]